MRGSLDCARDDGGVGAEKQVLRSAQDDIFKPVDGIFKAVDDIFKLVDDIFKAIDDIFEPVDDIFKAIGDIFEPVLVGRWQG